MRSTDKLLPSLALAAVLILTIAIALLAADPISIALDSVPRAGLHMPWRDVLSREVPSSIALAAAF